MAAAGMFGGILILFLIVLALLWCLVPFLIIGTNNRLERIAKQQAELIALLRKPQ